MNPIFCIESIQSQTEVVRIESHGGESARVKARRDVSVEGTMTVEWPRDCAGCTSFYPDRFEREEPVHKKGDFIAPTEKLYHRATGRVLLTPDESRRLHALISEIEQRIESQATVAPVESPVA